jgi:hypothetical protein
MSTTETYGTRSVPDMFAQVNELRRSIRAEGTPAVQDAWDKVEEHIDFAYRKPSEQVAALRFQIAMLSLGAGLISPPAWGTRPMRAPSQKGGGGCE